MSMPLYWLSGTEIERFRGQIANREALTFFNYWISKCSGNDMPRKERIDPIEIPELLSAMFIEEWDARGADQLDQAVKELFTLFF